MTEANGFAMPKGRTWSIATTSGESVSGYLPGWAQEDPSKSDVTPALYEAQNDWTAHFLARRPQD